MTIGSLDDPNAVTPGIHYGTEAQIKWLCINDELEREATNIDALKSRYPDFKSFQHPDHDTSES